jgi:hypothetical protein
MELRARASPELQNPSPGPFPLWEKGRGVNIKTISNITNLVK